ncbi:MAG: DUF1295 domain-containing protein [Anaerolineae bacterium]|nr:DUF1295 domain-containing protein [Anaerolineae bacterium]
MMFAASLLSIFAYGAVHSLMAALGFKSRMRRTLGERAYEGLYRLLYNAISAVLFAPVMLVVVLAPANALWRVPLPWAAPLMLLQFAALLCLTLAVLQADPLRFAGLSQLLAYLRGDPLPLPPEPLQTGGLYALVRHPLYLFSLLILWSVPVMTDTFLGLVIGATIYFVVGSRLEERRLEREFGEQYRRYRQRVPWMLPWPRPTRASKA